MCWSPQATRRTGRGGRSQQVGHTRHKSFHTKQKHLITKQKIKRNKKNQELLNLIKLPDTISSKNDVYYFKLSEAKINFITDKSVSSKTLFLQSKNIIKKDIYNKIIIIENADPGYDFLFTHKVNAIITKYGGPNSHLAIRCEELQIPAAIGVGNLFDRLNYRSVPDFIDLSYKGYHWFIFNVADIFITIGILCLILFEFIDYKKVSNDRSN